VLLSLNRQQTAFVPAKAEEIEMKTLCLVFMILAVNVSFAPIAKGQQTTQTVVNPSVLPDRLPIGSEQVMLDWIVTNRQWHSQAEQLFVYSDFTINYEKKGGLKNYMYFNFGNRKYESFEDFSNQLADYSLRIVDILRLLPDLDHDVPFVFTSILSYQNEESRVGIVGILLKKDLGYVDEITPESFKNIPIVGKQSVVRIPSLERFEVYVEAGEVNYTYSWPSKKVQPASVFPVELTSKDYISLSSWYSEGQYKARFKITAGGQTAEYTQHGAKIEPPRLLVTESGVKVDFTHGSTTTIQESENLISWRQVRTIPWDFGTNSVLIPFHSGSGNTEPKKFYRAKSE